MVVSWIPLTLSEARGFITSYTVFYSPQVNRTKQQEPNNMQKTVSGDVNRITIDGLDPNTAYDVQMSASTKAGASALSEVISAPVPDTGTYRAMYILFTHTTIIIHFYRRRRRRWSNWCSCWITYSSAVGCGHCHCNHYIY